MVMSTGGTGSILPTPKLVSFPAISKLSMNMEDALSCSITAVIVPWFWLLEEVEATVWLGNGRTICRHGD